MQATAFDSRNLVIAALHRLGKDVAVSAEMPSCIYIMLPGLRHLKVQVRTPAPRMTPPISEGYQVLALVRPDGSVEFQPPLD